jgi:CheY-like chemotaxis protein
MNLVINAAESFDRNMAGSITVRISQKYLDPSFFRSSEADSTFGNYVLLKVTDTGSGMDAATQSRIFEPFFTTKFLGRGLGLSAVHGIIAAHSGLLRLHSAPGKGTTFEVYFPAVRSREMRPPVRKESYSKDGSGTVLMVDDQEPVRLFATYALERCGYRVLTADDGQEAVTLFRNRQSEIDMIILDLTMPVMDGDEALDQLRAISRDVPIVISSGFSQATANERFRGKLLTGFLSKPYSATTLINTVKKFITQKEHAM